MKKSVLLIIILTFYGAMVFGQQKVVSFNIQNGTFTDELPFDERFEIRFTSSDEISAFTFQYKIQNFNKERLTARPRKYYFQEVDRVDKEGYISTTRKGINANSFSIGNIGPIHPNTPYTFEFKVLKKIILEEDKEKHLKEEIKEYLNSIYLGDDTIPVPEIVFADFNNILKKYVKESIVDEDGEKVAGFDFFISLNDQIRELRILQSEIKKAENDKNVSISNIIRYLSTVCSSLRSIDLNHDNWEALERAVNENVELFKDVNIKQFISFLQEDCELHTKMDQVLSGEKSLILNEGGLGTINIPKYQNIDALRLISSGFKALRDLKQPTAPHEYYFETSVRETFNNFSHEFDYDTRINNEKDGLIAIYENILALNNRALLNIPNILANKYIEEMLIQIDYNIFTDVQTKATPYVNMDLGVLYATSPRSPFIVETVNFHFSPINRDALLSDIDGFWNYLSKALSFQVGLAQRLGPTDNTYETYLTGTLGTPYLGAGFRVNRILRVSTGVLFYSKLSSNPVIASRYPTGSFVFSLSINSALSNALGGLNDLLSNDASNQ